MSLSAEKPELTRTYVMTVLEEANGDWDTAMGFLEAEGYSQALIAKISKDKESYLPPGETPVG